MFWDEFFYVFREVLIAETNRCCAEYKPRDMDNYPGPDTLLFEFLPKLAEHVARSVDRLGLGPGSGYVIPGPRQTLLLSMSISSSSQFVLAYSEKKIECHRTSAPY